MNSHDFAQGLRRGIPLGVAATWYHSFKTASWGDPPDETGVLEGQFAVPLEQVVAKLTEVIAAKFKLMTAYHIYAESMRGVAQHAVAEVFHEHAEQERAAAEAYLKRAAVLGGGPIHVPEIETPPASSDPVGILMIMVRAEQEGIALQHELKQMVGEDNPLTFQIEQFMIEDQHHMDEAWQMLPQDVQRQLAPPAEGLPPEPGAAMDGAVPPALPPELPVEEGESAPPVAAPPGEGPPSSEEPTVPSVPRPQRPPKPKGEAGKSEPSPEQKEAFVRGLRELVAKHAGIAQDIIDNMSDPERRRLMHEQHLRGQADEVHRILDMGRGDFQSAQRAARGRAGTAPHPLDKVFRDPRFLAAAELEPKLAMAFHKAMRKLGYSGPTEPGFGTDPATAPQPNAGATVMPQASMEVPGQQPPMANPPGSQQYDPVNYLEAEQIARQAQAQNEAGFYRDQAQTHAATAQSMGEQVQAIQQQLDQVQAQAAESNAQIMAANQEASQANDQMLNQATLAARMRMGMQQLRAQMMEIASQDPEQLAAAAGGPTPMDVGNQAAAAAGAPAGAPGATPTGLNGDQDVAAPPDQAEPGAQPGQPGAVESGGQPPGSPQPGAGAPSDTKDAPEESNRSSGEPAKKDNAETTVSIKKGSMLGDEFRTALPGAALGGVLGAIGGARSGKQVESLRQRVDALKGQPDAGGFGHAIDLAHTQLQLAQAEQARANPGRAALSGGLHGASLGFGLGAAVPGTIAAGRQAIRNVERLRNPL
jgi:bacterioferritin (cytochrome b1)